MKDLTVILSHADTEDKIVFQLMHDTSIKNNIKQKYGI